MQGWWLRSMGSPQSHNTLEDSLVQCGFQTSKALTVSSCRSPVCAVRQGGASEQQQHSFEVATPGVMKVTTVAVNVSANAAHL